MEKRGKGKPRIFKTGEEFLNKVREYVKYCQDNERFVNIAGFCVYADIVKETFYNQEEYYLDSFKKAQSLLEDSCLNNKNTTMAIFYLKNKFKYKDKIETENKNINTNKNYDLSKMSTEDIKELLKSED